MLDRFGDHLVALIGVADINLRHFAFAAGLADFVAHALEVLELAARDQHRRAARCELLGDRLANPGPAAGHNRNLAFDTEWILQNENFLQKGSLRFIALLRRVGERRRQGADGGTKAPPGCGWSRGRDQPQGGAGERLFRKPGRRLVGGCGGDDGSGACCAA